MGRLKLALALASALLLVFYLCDYAALLLRIPGNREQLASVEIRRYYAIKQKSGQTEYAPADPLTRTCVQSVFPHFGVAPCWYVRKHTVEYIDEGPPSLPRF